MDVDSTDELPELETAALEDLDAPPAAPPAPPPMQHAPRNPFDDPPPAPVATKSSETLSVDDLKDDILGGVDFDLPPPPAAGAAAPAPRPMAPRPSAQPSAGPAAPSFGGFKPATPAFASGAAPKPFGGGATVATPTLVAKAAEPMVDPKALFGEDPTDPTALRALLEGDAPVSQVPPETLRLAFKLCRALIKKGVISADDLL